MCSDAGQPHTLPSRDLESIFFFFSGRIKESALPKPTGLACVEVTVTGTLTSESLGCCHLSVARRLSGVPEYQPLTHTPSAL